MWVEGEVEAKERNKILKNTKVMEIKCKKSLKQ